MAHCDVSDHVFVNQGYCVSILAQPPGTVRSGGCLDPSNLTTSPATVYLQSSNAISAGKSSFWTRTVPLLASHDSLNLAASS